MAEIKSHDKEYQQIGHDKIGHVEAARRLPPEDEREGKESGPAVVGTVSGIVGMEDRHREESVGKTEEKHGEIVGACHDKAGTQRGQQSKAKQDVDIAEGMGLEPGIAQRQRHRKDAYPQHLNV